MATTKPIEVRRREAEGMRIITVVPEEVAKTAALEAGEAAAAAKAVGSAVVEGAPVPTEVVASKEAEVVAVPIEAVVSKAEVAAVPTEAVVSKEAEVVAVPTEAVVSKEAEAGAVSKMVAPKAGQAGVIANKVGSKAGQAVVLPIKVVRRAEGQKTTIRPHLQDRAKVLVTKAADEADRKAVAVPANAR